MSRTMRSAISGWFNNHRVSDMHPARVRWDRLWRPDMPDDEYCQKKIQCIAHYLTSKRKGRLYSAVVALLWAGEFESAEELAQQKEPK